MTTREDYRLCNRITGFDVWDDQDAGDSLCPAVLTGTYTSQEIQPPYPGGTIVLAAPIPAPPWLIRLVPLFNEILALPADWDSYGAKAIEPIQVCLALQVLANIMRPTTPDPSIVPTNRGGVQLEWHVGGIDLEIATVSSQSLRVSFEDSETEWEQDPTSDFGLLADCIARIS